MKKGGIFVKKFTKKVISVTVAALLSITTIFSSNAINVKAAQTQATVDAAQTATDTKASSIRVHFTPPNSAEDLATWTTDNSHIYAYAYYMDDEKTSVPLLGKWPGARMTEKDADGYYYVDVPTAPEGKTIEVIFSSVKDSAEYSDDDIIVQIPAKNQGGLELPKERWFEGGTLRREEATPAPSTTPTIATTPAVTATTPAVTATVNPTAVPTVEPVEGAQVAVDVPNGTAYYEEDSDTLTVQISPINGATSATYSIDNGPAKTITEATAVKIGEGKIANSPITLKVTSTDGTVSNTQTFTYYKATKVGSYTSVSLKSSLTKLFGLVKKTAEESKTTLKVTYKIPSNDDSSIKNYKRSNWTGDDVHIYAYAYYDTPETAADPDSLPIYPLGDWPGTEMQSEGNDTYSIDVSTTTGEAKIIFTSVQGEVAPTSTVLVDENGNSGLPFRPCNSIVQLPDSLGGYTIKGTTGTTINFDAAAMPTVEPTTVPTATPAEATETPIVSSTPTVDPNNTPFVEPTATPTTAPTATPVVKMDAYFGASLSAPQLNTTKQTLSAVVVNPQGTVTYTFAVDGTIIYNGNNASVEWNPEELEAGSHIITVSITDGKTLKSLSKPYTIERVAAPDTTETAPVVSTTPNVDVTTAPAITTSPAVSATPDVDVTTAPAITTSPAVSATPVIEPTATPVVTSSPAVTSTPLTASIKITSGKTAGETIPVHLNFAKKSQDPKVKYVYSYSVTKSKKTKTLASKTTKTTVNWTPSASGTYLVKVKIINKSTGKVLKTVSKKYTVKKRVITIKKLTTNKKSGQKKGTKIIITARAVTTKGKVSYKIVVRNSAGKTVATKNYSKTNKTTWKTKQKGTYKITAYVKNGKGVVVSKTITFKVK